MQQCRKNLPPPSDHCPFYLCFSRSRLSRPAPRLRKMSCSNTASPFSPRYAAAHPAGEEFIADAANLSNMAKTLLSVDRSEMPKFEPVRLTLDMLVAEGERLEMEQQQVSGRSAAQLVVVGGGRGRGGGMGMVMVIVVMAPFARVGGVPCFARWVCECLCGYNRCVVCLQRLQRARSALPSKPRLCIICIRTRPSPLPNIRHPPRAPHWCR